MRKHELKFKRKVVQDYLSGKGDSWFYQRL